MAGPKKAKLAHEKRKSSAKESAGSSFALTKIIEVIEANGTKAAIAEIDGKGTLGVVDFGYVTKDAAGGLVPRAIACPATYDPAAIKAAVERYQAHAG